jgi:two-component system, cell cycle response regulator DivK
MRTCLIVEDHGDTREGYAEFLAFSGFEVLTAGDGAAMWQILDERLPDAIVMDLHLPETDGWSLIRQLRSLAPTRGIPVVVVSASVREQDRKEAERAGCDSFIQKPCDPEAIVVELHRLIDECSGGKRTV